jgi:NAD(P)-dependent dehydrogenase (short-subunit alcohol dehydrogenase family)
MSEVKRRRVAFVTGGASGIGRATAMAFAGAGHLVAIADIDETAGTQVAEDIRATGSSAIFVKCDVSDEAQVEAAIARTVERFSRLDAAFNCAGLDGRHAPTAEYPADDWHRTLAVNLTGVWYCMVHEIRQMLKQGGGSIVNCASAAGLRGIASVPAYTASKHGVVGLTKTAALDYAAKGIRVNAVCPGGILTPMLEQAMGDSEEVRQAAARFHPVGRLGQPQDIASAVLWLCSDGASFATGQAIAIDGGWTAA